MKLLKEVQAEQLYLFFIFRLMIIKFKDKAPEIHETCFIADDADIIGDVIIGKNSSVWFKSVVRGDVNHIRIGDNTNIQDSSVLHVTTNTHPLIIGNSVTAGHMVILHGCTIKDRVLIGMGSIIQDLTESILENSQFLDLLVIFKQKCKHLVEIQMY